MQQQQYPDLPPYRLDRRPLYWFLGAMVLAGAMLLTADRLAAQAPVGSGTPVVTVPGNAPEAPQPPLPSQPAVPTTEVKSPAAPAHFGDQAIWALIVSMLVQYLKKAQWLPWLSEASTARLKTQVGFAAAVLTAVGVHFVVSGSVFDDGGASITVSGLSLAAGKDIAWQWASQQAWYRLVVKA